jgi:sugar phosphate permease
VGVIDERAGAVGAGQVSGVSDEAAGRYRWAVLAIATFAQAAACLFVQSSGAVSPFLVRDLGLTATQLGLLLSAAQLVPIVGLVVAGELLDRYNERWVVGGGTLVVAAGLLAAGGSGRYPVLLACLLVVGAGYSTAQPGGSVSVSQWFPGSERGLAMGIRQAGLPVGGAIGAAVLPELAHHVRRAGPDGGAVRVPAVRRALPARGAQH